MKWYLADEECAICELEMLSLFPEGPLTLECAGCGYMNQVPFDKQEVPESFAKAEHERFNLVWET